MKPIALRLLTMLLTLAVAGWGNAQESIILLNPSFEEQTHLDASPAPTDGSVFVDAAGIAGAGNNPSSITDWTYTGIANHGVNNADVGHPFADNGLIPDSGSVAFLQQPGVLSQSVSGLDPSKQYWLQFYVNSRNSSTGIPGDAGIPNGRVEFAGTELIPPVPVASLEETGVRNQEWTFVNIPFTPSATSGDLKIELTSVSPAPVGSGTDGALVLDAFSLIQRHPNEIVIQNPSFEASGRGTPFPGYQSKIAGWTAIGGGVGTNPDSGGGVAFADNGALPEGNNVAFIQGQKTLGQTINNLTIGKEYEISFSYNARAGDDLGDPNLDVTLGTNTILNSTVAPVGGLEPYHHHSSFFTAANASELLTFAQTAAGDNSVLLDNVKITDLGAPVEYTIDEVLSSLTLSGTIQGETANGQGGPGGRTTNLEGSIAARLNGNTLSFRGGSDIDAKLNPNAPFDPAGAGEDNLVCKLRYSSAPLPPMRYYAMWLPIWLQALQISVEMFRRCKSNSSTASSTLMQGFWAAIRTPSSASRDSTNRLTC